MVQKMCNRFGGNAESAWAELTANDPKHSVRYGDAVFRKGLTLIPFGSSRKMGGPRYVGEAPTTAINGMRAIGSGFFANGPLP